ncbi:calcium/sodium antiporter [Kineococcus terrestris]|uniref:calcium/sodium antiporter n=1 Tax=Kineococcus terrestris TaxID=2044856 RepID=UPI0034DB2C28
MLVDTALLLGGLVALTVGGEWLVRGASRLARALGVSPLVVGLTVVSMATSAPELAVSIGAALSGAAPLAVGNVVGSNTVNVLVVLGLAAVVAPVPVQRSVLRTDLPAVVGFSVLLLLLALDQRVGTVDGAVLVVLLAAHVAWTVHRERRSAGQEPADGELTPGPRPRPAARAVVRDLALVVVGTGSLVLGAELLVRGATSIAADLGVSELAIGLTVVAVGTSLPEVVTSVLAAARGEHGIAVGNVLGSNLFNIGAVAGLTAVVAPDGLPVTVPSLQLDLPVMIAAAVLLLPLARTGGRITRLEGSLMLLAWAGYTTYLLARA